MELLRDVRRKRMALGDLTNLRWVFSMAGIGIVVWVFVVSLMGCAGSMVQGKRADAVDVTVLFFNDLHGHLKPFEVRENGSSMEVGGIARLATLVQKIRSENSKKGIRTVVLAAGDILQGTPMSTVFRGKADIECLNAMGVDAATVGNHEFDFGMDNFLKLQKQATFPWLSANILQKENNRPLCPSYLTLPLGEGVGLSIIGVTTTKLMVTSKAENVAALQVLDAVSAVRQVYGPVAKKGPVLLLSHSRHQTDRDIATALPDLAAVIGGHDQILLSPHRRVGQVPIFQAFEKGRYLGRIDLKVDMVTKKAHLIQHQYIPVTADIQADPEVEKIVLAYDQKLGESFKEVIGQSRSFLDGGRERIRYQETNLGNFIADIMVENTDARIALINSGGIRSSIKAGDITVEDVFKTMPYANELVLVQLTGADIKKVLQRSVSGALEDEDGGFLHVSGLSFDIRGKEVENIRTGQNALPLVAKAAYTVVLPDFLASGGDGYIIFKDKPIVKTGSPLRELLVSTIRQRGTIDAKVEGRIVRIE
jgi:5'-nucleotidase/UDP-sugar diphosphatase